MIKPIKIIAHHVIPFTANKQSETVMGQWEKSIKTDKSVVLVKGSIVSSGVLLTLVLGAFAALGFTGVLPIGMVGSGLFTGGAGVAGGLTLLYEGGILLGVIVRRAKKDS